MNIRSIAVLTLIGALAGSVHAQNIQASFGGEKNATDFAYGLVNGNTGAECCTEQRQFHHGLIDNYTELRSCGCGEPGAIQPDQHKYSNHCRIRGNQETVTPTGVSGCGAGQPLGACQVTASLTLLHGPDEPVTSGTYGLQEAINAAWTGGGGRVLVSPGWVTIGGTAAIIAAATPYPSVSIENNAGSTLALAPFYSEQPSTLTSLAVPTTLAAGTVVFAAAPVGTWANSAYYFCVTYVDALGGEGPCSLTYNQTPTANYSVTITSPAASTGAVGWRFYAGASYNAAYLMPINSTHCTLTTLELVMPACAIGSNGGWIAPPLTTTSLRPNATVSAGVAGNSNCKHQRYATPGAYDIRVSADRHTAAGVSDSLRPVPGLSGRPHRAVGYSRIIQTARRIPECHRAGRQGPRQGVAGTVNTAALPTITAFDVLGWQALQRASAVTTCSFEGVAVGATKTYNGQFECEHRTNAFRRNGSRYDHAGWILTVAGSGHFRRRPWPYVDTNTAAVGSLGLFAQNTINIVYTSNTNTTTAPVMLGLDVDVLQ